MSKLNVAYIGNCSEEFSGVLDSFCGDLSTVVSVCDSDIKRGLTCVEKYLCNFVEDYRAIVTRENMKLIVIESCGSLRKEEICAAAEAGKNLFVILDETTLMQVDAVGQTVRKAQDQLGIQAVFVTVDELDNDFWSGLPFSPQDIGNLLNVTIGLPSRAPGSVSLNRNAYDAVRTLYELLGAPVSYLGIQGRTADDLYTAAASYRYESGAIASVQIGGGARAHTIRVYGDRGCALVGRNMVHYRLEGSDWVKQKVQLQQRRTRKPTLRLVEAIYGGNKYQHGHSLEEVLVTSHMLRTILMPSSR